MRHHLHGGPWSLWLRPQPAWGKQSFVLDQQSWCHSGDTYRGQEPVLKKWFQITYWLQTSTCEVEKEYVFYSHRLLYEGWMRGSKCVSESKWACTVGYKLTSRLELLNFQQTSMCPAKETSVTLSDKWLVENFANKISFWLKKPLYPVSIV